MITFFKSNARISCCLVLISLLAACGGTQPTKETATVKAQTISALTPAEKSQFDNALSELENDNFGQAEKQLTRLSTQRQAIAEIWLNLALARHKQGKDEQAYQDVQKALSLSKSSAQPYNLAGLIAMKLGKFDASQQHFTQALKLNAQYYQALFNMALLQDVYLQDIKTAIPYYERYLAIQKDDTKTADWLAHLKRSL